VTPPVTPPARPPHYQGLLPPATLDNCDREPIHIPGAIQNHGALLALDAEGLVRYASANTGEMLGHAIEPGTRWTPELLGEDDRLDALIAEGLAAVGGRGDMPMPAECHLAGRTFDVVLHTVQSLLVVEFEGRRQSSDELTGFALQAHRAMEKLRRPRAIEDLLQLATEELRALTGFDRVMAYRFRHDASGDVVAEACADTLDPYLGRRYPASDIPSQARRLYVANTLRMIADVGSPPVPLLQLTAEPLDLSAGVLRSVSPIHIEYLTNMGVGASMSVSIVINDQLWGLLACHHMAPRQVPYSVRMACDVIAQMLAANIQTALTRAQAERLQEVAALRTHVMENVLHSDDEFATLCEFAAPLARALNADGAIVAERSKFCQEGPIPLAVARILVQWLQATQSGQGHDLFHTHALPLESPAVAAALAPWCGVLGLPLDRSTGSWLIFLRKEQVETIHWGGKPDKETRFGPLGPRLTPRGSFDLWKETVRSTAVPWSAEDLKIAQQMLDELVRSQNGRNAELNRARNQLMAVLGHDLRDPLHSISMAARVLEKTEDAGSRTGRIGQRIQSSSSRMQRLVSQVMDMSRLQNKLGLDVHPEPLDLVPLVADLLDESRTAHPLPAIHFDAPSSLMAFADPDRVAQVIVNLVSNARHHGQVGEAIEVRAFTDEQGPTLQVSNVAPEIPPEVAEALFKPFKPTSLNNPRNRGGMGLGLYIAHQIVMEHGGDLRYHYASPRVVFTLQLRAPLGHEG